jgi:hypothetical protein
MAFLTLLGVSLYCFLCTRGPQLVVVAGRRPAAARVRPVRGRPPRRGADGRVCFMVTIMQMSGNVKGRRAVVYIWYCC